MEKKKAISVLCVLLLSLLLVSTAMGGDWKEKDFIELWKKIRTAVVEQNLEDFKNLTIPPDPEEMEKMTKADFAEMVEFFLIDAFPEWSTVNLLKFDKDDKTAILILQLHEANEEYKDWIMISAYRFLLTDAGWKLSGNLYDTSVEKSSDAKENQKRIEKELKENTDLQLAAE